MGSGSVMLLNLITLLKYVNVNFNLITLFRLKKQADNVALNVMLSF